MINAKPFQKMKENRVKLKLLSIVGIVIVLALLNFALLSQSNMKKVRPLLILNDANAPSLSFDGKRIAVGPKIGLDEVYDVDTGRRLGAFSVDMSHAASLSSDGTRLRIFADSTYHFFDADKGEKISEGKSVMVSENRIKGKISVTFASGLLSKNITFDLNVAATFNAPQNYDNPDPKYPALLIGRFDSNSVVRELRSDDDFVRGDVWKNGTLTPNGKYAAATRQNLARLPRDRTVVWDVETGKVIFSLPFFHYGFSLSDDGSRIATRRPDDSKIEIWNVKEGTKVSTISLQAKGRTVKVNALAISPDGKLLVTTRDASFYFWDTETGKFIASQKQDDVSGGYSKVAVFSGDGKRIAVCTFDETITVWSVEDILKAAKR